MTVPPGLWSAATLSDLSPHSMAIVPLSDHNKLIVTEQDVDQVLARPGRRVCRRRNLARGAAPEGGQLRRVAEQFRLLREESLGLVALPGRRGAPQYGLEGRVNE